MTSSDNFADWNLLGSDRKALLKAHDDHWDSKNGKPKVLVKMKKEGKVEESKPPKKKDSNSTDQASNEKEGKTKKAKPPCASGSSSDRQKEDKLTKKGEGRKRANMIIKRDEGPS